MPTVPHINLCVIQPTGYVHSMGLLDAAAYFGHQFQRLGATVDMTWNTLRSGSINLVFGAHLGFSAEHARGSTCVIVNLEQLGDDGARLPAGYLDLLRRLPVIDYDRGNCAHYETVPGEAPVVEFGYASYLSGAPCTAEDLARRPIDLLFFGSMNERRRALIARIEATGRRVTCAPAGLYGEERDRLIVQAKAVVNLHHYESARFEQVRAFQVLSLGTPLVSERTSRTQPPESFDLCTLWFDDASLETCFARDVPSPMFLEFGARALEVFRDADPIEQFAEALSFATGVHSVRGPGLATGADAPAAPEAGVAAPSANPSAPLRADDAPRAAAPAVAGPPPRCSVVVPVFNKVEFTRQCVDALRASTPAALYELIVVDNASTDGTAAYLAGLPPEVRVVSNTENLGFVDACNQGAALARGEHVVFLNNDTMPAPGWLQALSGTLDADPKAGAVGARLVYPDGRLQEAGGLIFSDGSGWNFGRFGDPDDPAHATPAEVDYCSGAALMVRRELFERLGGFDRRYAPAYYEDTDLCFGVRSLGYTVRYCPAATVVHFEGITAGTDLSSGFKRYQEINRAKFVEKWADALKSQDPPPSVTGRAPTTADRRRLAAPAPLASPAPVAARTPVAATPAGDAPHVLVIDPFLPMHDRASGSLRLFRILESLRASGAAVTFIARNGNGQDVYRRQLEAMGVTVHATDPDKMAQLGYRCDAPRIDLARILTERPVTLAWISFYDVAEQYLPDIRRLSPRTTVAVDTVDVHFLRESRQAALAGDARALHDARITRARELAVYGRADLVVTVSDADAQVLRDAGLATPTLTVPNVHADAGATPGFADRSGLVFVGNFNHPPNVDAAGWLVREVLPRVHATRPDIRLEIVGTNPPESVLALASDRVTVRGWVPDTAPYLDAARLSIAPLRVGAGMKGKVGEALSRGLPVITTPIGAEGMGLEHGTHVLVADDAEGLARHVLALHDDAAAWSAMSRAGRAHVEARFGPEAVAGTLRDLLAAAGRGRAAATPAPADRGSGADRGRAADPERAAGLERAAAPSTPRAAVARTDATWIVLSTGHEDRVTESFAESIAAALRANGHAARAAAATPQLVRTLAAAPAGELAGVITVGTLPLRVTLDGRPMHRVLDCPVHAYFLDSPVYDLVRIAEARQFVSDAWSDPRLVPVVAERSYLELLRAGSEPILPPQSRYMPFAAFPVDDDTAGRVPDQRRLLVAGTLGGELFGWTIRQDLLQTLRDSNAPGLSDNELVRVVEALVAPDARGNVVAGVVEAAGIGVEALRHHAVLHFACAADSHVKRLRRLAAVESLRGVDVDFVGRGWEERFGGQPGFRFLGTVGHQDIGRLIPRYRGVVNFDPNWEWGMHDRVYTALAAGVPVLTHANRAVAEEGLDPRQVLQYAPNAPGLGELATDVLSRPAGHREPATAARIDWTHRLGGLLGERGTAPARGVPAFA